MLWQQSCAAICATAYALGVLFLLLVEDSDKPGDWMKISLKGFNLGVRQGFMALAQLLCFGWLYYFVLQVFKLHEIPYAWCYLHSRDVAHFADDVDPGNFVGHLKCTLPFPPKNWPCGPKGSRVQLKSPHEEHYHRLLRSSVDSKGQPVVFEPQFRPHGTSRVLALCSYLTVLWAVPLAVYTLGVYYNSSEPIYPAVWCLGASMLGMLCFVLLPIVPPFPATRLAFGAYLGQVLLAPIWGVEFVHVLVGDAMTSSCLCLYLLELTACRAITGSFSWNSQDTCADKTLLHYQIANPVMFALPFWIRAVQCLYKIYDCKQKGTSWRNHALNAGKYSSAIMLVLASVLQMQLDDPNGPYWTPLRFHWLFWVLMKSLYCTVWDIRMDWDLGRGESSSKKSAGSRSVFAFSPSRSGPSPHSSFTFDHFPSPDFSGSGHYDSGTLSPSSPEPSPPPEPAPVSFPWRLRPRRRFGSCFYYYAFVSNLIMRFAWSMAITSWSFYPDFPPSWADILAFIEIGRRAQWMVIRVEFEYWNLKDKYSKGRPMTGREKLREAQRNTPVDGDRQLLLFY